MKVVLDTNVLLVSFSQKSMFRPIFDAILDERITVCLTTDILIEYEEIITRHAGPEIAAWVLQLIESAPNKEWITTYFKWNLISTDPDDNKFSDCVIACNVRYLVSDDKHFNVLKSISFPRVSVLAAEEFVAILKETK